MNHRPTTVLIAEDDPVFRRVMSFSIARTGLTVESVGDGLAAYERLCQGGIDFLVTDHQMPICSGLELLEKLADNQQLTAPPTILCTAKGLELDRELLGARFQLVDVIHKPFSPRKLIDSILKHVSNRDVAAGNGAKVGPRIVTLPSPVSGGVVALGPH
jgi:CheY-like chemotaxis protein